MVNVLPNPTSTFAWMVVTGFSTAVLFRRGARRAGVAHWVAGFPRDFPVVATARRRNPCPSASLAFFKDPFPFPFPNRFVFMLSTDVFVRHFIIARYDCKFRVEASANGCVKQLAGVTFWLR